MKDGAAAVVFGFIFDMATGRPVGRAWQQEHGGTIGVYGYFHSIDCQDTKPTKPALVMGTASDWHRMGLNLARNRKPKGQRCVKPAKS